MLPNQGQDSVCNITSATVSGQYIVLFKLLYDCSSVYPPLCSSFFSQAAIIMGKHVFSTNNFCLFVWYLRVCCDVNIYPSFSCLFFPVSSLPPSLPPGSVSWGCICLVVSLGQRETETLYQTGRTLTLFSGP